MLLKNCKIINSEKVINADVLIEGEKIKEIGTGLKDDEIIDVKGKPVIPGIIDLHTHMRDFDQKYKEDFISGSRAALAGGVTTFIDMPNSSPPVVDAHSFTKRLEVAEKKSLVDFGINFGFTGTNLDSLEEIEPSFCKVYLDGSLGGITDDALEDAIRGCPKIAVHAEDEGIIKKNLEKLRGVEDPLIYSKIREPKAEETAVAKTCKLASSVKRKVHICHISLKKSLRYLNEFTTCEVTPHHLLLSEKKFKELGGIAKTNPPLRSSQDVRALWEAIGGGRIDVIVSDHAPHREDEKEDIISAPPGIPNLDVMLRIFLTLVNKKVITLHDIVRLMCENPAKILGLQKGEIKVGNYADLVILNLKEKSVIEVDEFYSKAKYSPFDGWRTVGNVERVFLRGKIAFEDGDFTVKKGYGKWIGGM
jgi:dihydroorotase